MKNIFTFIKKIIFRRNSFKYIESTYEHNDNQFVVTSNNCWGAEIYKKLNKEYNTPFVGLYIYAPDYLKLLQNFDALMLKKIVFTDKSKWLQRNANYPIGLIDDIEIHFLHYKSEDEATSKWERRLERMNEIKNKDLFFFKICDRDEASMEIINEFHKLSFKNKISFAVMDILNVNHLKVKEYDEHYNCVPDGVNLFNISNKYTDVVNWLNTGVVIKK